MVLQQTLHQSECKPTFHPTHGKPKCFSLFTTNFRVMVPVLLYMKAQEKLRQASAGVGFVPPERTSSLSKRVPPSAVAQLAPARGAYSRDILWLYHAPQYPLTIVILQYDSYGEDASRQTYLREAQAERLFAGARRSWSYALMKLIQCNTFQRESGLSSLDI